MEKNYVDGMHKFGVRWFLIAYLPILLFPIIACLYFNAWPNGKELLTAALGVVPISWTVGVVEAFTYMPMLGAGGSYLAFVTGNMSNLKVPVALNAMDSLGIKQGSEDGEVISTIVIAVSSIVTTAIIIIFVALTVPLSPIFSAPVLQPAFSNVVPALFGGMMVAYLAKSPKVAVPIVALGAALFIAIPSLASIYPLVLPVLAALAILLSRILYKKGKI